MVAFLLLVIASAFEVKKTVNEARPITRVHDNHTQIKQDTKKSSVWIGDAGAPVVHKGEAAGADVPPLGDEAKDGGATDDAVEEPKSAPQPFFEDFSKHYKILGSFRGTHCRNEDEVPTNWTMKTEPGAVCSRNEHKDSPNWYSNMDTQETTEKTAPPEFINAWKRMQCSPGLSKVEDYLSPSGGMKCAAFKNMELCVNANDRNMAYRKIFCINEDFTGYQWGFPEGNCCECGKGRETSGEIVTMKTCCALGYMHKASLGCRLAEKGLPALEESSTLEDEEPPAADAGAADAGAADAVAAAYSPESAGDETEASALPVEPLSDRERMYRYVIFVLFSTAVLLAGWVYKLVEKR